MGTVPEPASRWVSASGWILLAGASLFLGGYVYEQTYLTWKLGPSDLPYAGTLLNVPLFLSGFVVIILSHLWLIVVLGCVVWKNRLRER